MYIAVDIGGTHIRIASSTDGLSIENKADFPTPQDYHQGLHQIIQTVTQLAPGANKLVVGFPGHTERHSGIIEAAPHLPHWVSHNLQADLSKALSAEVVVENDASLAAIGEANVGAGKGHKVVVYLTLSTGIGGAKVIDGLLDPATLDAEPGHFIVDPYGKEWPYCGHTGCFESVGSGTAFEQTFHIKAEECTDPHIWDQHALATSKGMALILNLWQPEILVLGGGLTMAGARFIEPLKTHTEEELGYPPPPIVLADFGDNSGLIGGFWLEQSVK